MSRWKYERGPPTFVPVIFCDLSNQQESPALAVKIPSRKADVPTEV